MSGCSAMRPRLPDGGLEHIYCFRFSEGEFSHGTQ
nr:MAG TPA_asm: hypothetical protein [Caudoviricetes sp.]